MKKLLFLLTLTIVILASCDKEEVAPTPPAKPKYLDTCRCTVGEVFSGNWPADSCGTFYITDIGSYLPGGGPGGFRKAE